MQLPSPICRHLPEWCKSVTFPLALLTLFQYFEIYILFMRATKISSIHSCQMKNVNYFIFIAITLHIHRGKNSWVQGGACAPPWETLYKN